MTPRPLFWRWPLYDDVCPHFAFYWRQSRSKVSADGVCRCEVPNGTLTQYIWSESTNKGIEPPLLPLPNSNFFEFCSFEEATEARSPALVLVYMDTFGLHYGASCAIFNKLGESGGHVSLVHLVSNKYLQVPIGSGNPSITNRIISVSRIAANTSNQ